MLRACLRLAMPNERVAVPPDLRWLTSQLIITRLTELVVRLTKPCKPLMSTQPSAQNTSHACRPRMTLLYCRRALQRVRHCQRSCNERGYQVHRRPVLLKGRQRSRRPLRDEYASAQAQHCRAGQWKRRQLGMMAYIRYAWVNRYALVPTKSFCSELDTIVDR